MNNLLFNYNAMRWHETCHECHDFYFCYFHSYRHLSRRHAARYDAYLKERHSAQVTSGHAQMTSFTTSDAKYGSLNPHQKILSESLVNNLIINCSLPISIVDNPYFRNFLADIDSKFIPPCRQTVTSSILPQHLSKMKTKIQNRLNKCTDVALTTDAWTDRRSHAFLGVTVHTFLHGTSYSHLLAFRSFPGKHTGQRVADELNSIIVEYDIQRKLRFIVSDNASNMKLAMHLLLDTVDEAESTLE